MTVLLLSRALDTNNRLMLSHNVTSEIPHFNVFIWIICALMQQYICSYEQDCLNPGVFKFLRKWAAFMVNDLRMQESFNAHANNRIAQGYFMPV